jgi:hypothetical protein
MVRTWGWAALAVAVQLAAWCPAQGQHVGILADTDARACLARSYSVVPQPGSNYLDPNQPWPVNDGDVALAMSAAPDGSVVISYVVMLAVESAVFSALASLLVLALAGIFVKIEDRRRRPTTSAESLPRPDLAMSTARKLPA